MIEETQRAQENGFQGDSEALLKYPAFISNCSENFNDSLEAKAYLTARGISAETAKKYLIGFDAEWISPKAIERYEKGEISQQPKPTARLIIPINTGCYIARDINSDGKYSIVNETGSGKMDVFNVEALYNEQKAVFVVEGVLDAMSISETGYEAIALNGTDGKLLINRLKEWPTESTLILCLDNDKEGKEATQKLMKDLDRMQANYIAANICGNYKDPNDALVGNREEFIKAVKQAVRESGARPDNVKDYLKDFMQADIDRMKESKECKTGFQKLDELSRGLYPGLYVIAAISSLGKTTFTHQIADNLAMAGNDVLFFSLEQSRLELVSKSITRIIAINDINSSITSLTIRKGFKHEDIDNAIIAYQEKIADRFSIIEGNFGCDVSYIGNYIRRYIKQTGTRPIVFIDYLQILQPAADSKRTTTKEAIDNTVTEIKRISRELNLTIFVISSINRTNYLAPIDFESLKESGNIEYTADVIWGLQLQCLSDNVFKESNNNKIFEKREKVKQAKAKEPREIQLVCLKNRYGISSFDCDFYYYPAKDLFKEAESKGQRTRY